MWYQISQEDMYIIQGAISAHIAYLERMLRNWKAFEVRQHAEREIANLKRISDNLYDGGYQSLDEIGGG